jgi:transketolase
MRCLEQICGDACYYNINVKVLAVGGRLVCGAVGYTHHVVEGLAVRRTIPNIAVRAGDPVEVRLGDTRDSEQAGTVLSAIGQRRRASCVSD